MGVGFGWTPVLHQDGSGTVRLRRNRPFVGRGEPTELADIGHSAALR
jgi:hypothetical protein